MGTLSGAFHNFLHPREKRILGLGSTISPSWHEAPFVGSVTVALNKPSSNLRATTGVDAPKMLSSNTDSINYFS